MTNKYKLITRFRCPDCLKDNEIETIVESLSTNLEYVVQTNVIIPVCLFCGSRTADKREFSVKAEPV